jgi:nitrite reductase (NADH) small subunit
MLVLTFRADGGAGNCAVVEGEPYVFARTGQGSFVLRAQCPHRGGPMHLAEAAEGGARLVCPWHGRTASVERMIRSGLPAVRSGNTVTAVFGVPAGADHAVGYRPLSADLQRKGTAR